MDTNENPYSSPISSSPVASNQADKRSLTLPTVLILLGSLAWGGASWHANSFLSHSPYLYSPDWMTQWYWFTPFATLICYLDYKKVVYVWLGFYLGTYVFHLPFMPADPLIPLGMTLGVVLTCSYALLGVFIGSGLKSAIRGITGR